MPFLDVPPGSSGNIVALCDISETNLNQAAAKHPAARKYVDFRKEIRADYSEMRLEETLALTPALPGRGIDSSPSLRVVYPADSSVRWLLPTNKGLGAQFA